MRTLPDHEAARDPLLPGPLEEIEALRDDLEGVHVPRRLWWTIRLRLFLSALRQPGTAKETLPQLNPGPGEHRFGIAPRLHRGGTVSWLYRGGTVSRLHRFGLASAAGLLVFAWVGLSGSMIDQRQVPATRVEALAPGGVFARVQARPLQPGLGNPLVETPQPGTQSLAQGAHGLQTVPGIQEVQGSQRGAGALLSGGYRRDGSPNLVSLVGMESLAMLGLPYLVGSGDLVSSAATRSGEWITLAGGEVLALRLFD